MGDEDDWSFDISNSTVSVKWTKIKLLGVFALYFYSKWSHGIVKICSAVCYTA